jgi:N-acetyl sugar amidotransferase
MDTSDPGISFDNEGRCNHCVVFFDRTAKLMYRGEQSRRQLDVLVDRIKRSGESKEYDCVIGMSGGGDSCYAAYVAHSLGLRSLAVHMDNGWDSNIAVKNIRRVAEKLGIDYRSYVLNWDEFRDLQLSFFKASVPEIETPTDMAIPAALHRIAAEHGVRYIISGGNYATEGILPKAWHYDAKDMRFLRAVHRSFGSTTLKSYPTFGYRTEAYFKLIKGMRFVYLLNYVPYSKSDAMALLEKELGWRDHGGKHHESKITEFVHSYVLPVKFGIDYRRATLSAQICAGEATRGQALAELEKLPYDPAQVESDKDYVARKFGIARKDLDDMLASPPKSYRDYPNDQRFLEFVYRVYRRIFSA